MSKKNLFDAYVKKEIFNIILSFLPKVYIISKRLVCKNWYEILTCSFTKSALNVINEPYHIKYLRSFFKFGFRIRKVNNKICCYHFYYSDFVIVDNYGFGMEDHNDDNTISYIAGYSNIICYYNRHKKKVFISDFNGKISIKLNIKIYDITMDKEYVYILGKNNVYQYNIYGVFVRDWTIENHKNGIKKGKIVVDKNEIFIYGKSYRHIKIYSKTGGFIGIIGDNFGEGTTFDVYKDHIYLLDSEKKVLKVFARKGKIVYSINNKCIRPKNLFVIDDNLCIFANYEVHVYELKFY